MYQEQGKQPYRELRETNYKLLQQLTAITLPLLSQYPGKPRIEIDMELMFANSFKGVDFRNFPGDALNGLRVIGRKGTMSFPEEDPDSICLDIGYHVVGIDEFYFYDHIVQNFSSTYIDSWVEDVPTSLCPYPGLQKNVIVDKKQFQQHQADRKRGYLDHYNTQLRGMIQARERGDVRIY